MSRWRNVNPASYAPKSDNIGEFAQGFADVFVPTYLKKKALEEQRAYDEEKERKARAAAAAKAAKAQEAKDKKLARDAKALTVKYSGSDNNPEALVYFTQQLQLYGGDVTKVENSTVDMMDRGNLKFVTKTESRPLQGPDVPSDFPTSLTVGDKTYDEVKSGGPLTVGALDNVANNENNSDAVRDEAGQMSEIFAPVSEEPNMDTPVEGIEITPFGQQEAKLDYDRLGSLDDIRRYEMEIEAEGIKLSKEALGIIEQEKKFLETGAVEASIKEAYSDETYTDYKIARLESTPEGRKSDEYIALQAVKQWHQNQEPKPYSALVSAEAATEAEDVDELQRKLRVAMQMGASEDETAALRNEIVIRSQQETTEASTLSVEDTVDLATRSVEELKNIQTALQSDDRPEAVAMNTVVGTLLAGKENVNLSEYLTGIGSVNATKERILQITNDTSIDEKTKKSVLDIMNNHLKDLEQDATELKLTDQEYFGEVSIKGKPVRVDFILTEKGEFFSPTLQKTFSRTEVTNPQSVDNFKTMMGNATRLQDNVFAKVIASRTNVEDLLIRAKSLDDIVRTSDASVLTFIGGKAASVIQRLENEVGALDAYFRGNSEEDIRATISQIVTSDAQDKNTQDAMEKVGINADLYARYQSQLIEFAFVYARTGLGQERTTDQDFKAAMNVVAAGSSYPTFTKSLRDLVKKSYEINQVEHDKYLKRPDVLIAVDQPGADKYYADFLIDMNTYMGGQQNMQTPIGWMNQTVTAPESSETKVVTTDAPKVLSIGQRVGAMKNSPLFNDIKNQLTSITNADTLSKSLDIYAKQFDVPVDVLRKEVGLTK
jgi:hypothetical protein